MKEEVRIWKGRENVDGEEGGGMWGIMLEMLKAGGEVVVQ